MDALTRSVEPVRGRRRGRAGIVCLLAAGGCTIPVAVGLPPGVEAPRAEGACPGTPGQLVLERVNEIRADHGLAPLVADQRLVEAAARHSADQARNRFSGHIGSDRSTAGERARSAGYRWRMVAENVAQGYPTARAVVAGWMDSPPHRAAILAPDPAHAGVGYAAGPVDLRHFWTLKLAAPEPGLDGAALSCHP